MSCEEIRRHWDLYYDSEGDAELHWQINEHLDNCPACAEWFAKQSRFEDLLSGKLGEVSASEELWTTVLTRAGVVRSAPTRRWLLFSSLAACAAAALLLIGASWYWLNAGVGASHSLSALTAEWHERLATGRETVEFVSESDMKVEDFLRHEVAFPVRCPPRKDSGFAVRGAGTCRLAGQAAAVVVGHVDRDPVSIFILARDSLTIFPDQQAVLQADAIHQCREGKLEMAFSVIDRNLVLVVGQVTSDSLLRILRAYGTYPHQT